MAETTSITKCHRAAAGSESGGDRSATAVPDLRSGHPLPFIAGALVVVSMIYWPSSAALAELWTDTQNRTYTHGYLILLVSLWLIVRERTQLQAAPVRPVPWALPTILLLSALWLVAWRAGIQDLFVIVLPALAFAVLLAIFGWRLARLLAFPLGFLYFAMPLWSDLVGVLQHLTVQANDALIWLTGLPAYIDGNFVRLPGGTLEISDGCSGLHFLIVGLAMAALYGELSRDSIPRRALWLGLMGTLAIVANWMRIFGIVVAAYATDMQTFLVKVDHYWFGWGVFAVSFAGFLWIANRWPARPDGAPERSEHGDITTDRSTLSFRTYAAALICMASPPIWAYAVDSWRSAPQSAVAIDWPVEHGVWNGPDAALRSPWKPVFVRATAAALRQYVDAEGRAVELFAVAYGSQRHGMKLVSYDNSLLGKDPALAVRGERIVHTNAGAWLEATVTDQAGTTSLLWAQYRIGNRSFVWPQLSQLWYGIVALKDQPLSSLVALRTDCYGGCESAHARLESAAMRLMPSVHLGTAIPKGT